MHQLSVIASLLADGKGQTAVIADMNQYRVVELVPMFSPKRIIH